MIFADRLLSWEVWLNMIKKKPLPKSFKHSILGRLYQTKAGVLFANWLFQGIRYMNVYEVSLKLLLDISIAFFLINSRLPLRGTVWGIFSIVLAHTLNWLLNSQFYVTMRYVIPASRPTNVYKEYLQGMLNRGLKRRWLDGIAVFGSYCRGTVHGNSDLDVRFTVLPGVIPGLFGALYCLEERVRAFFTGFPLDIYSCSGSAGLEKLRTDETPVILLDKSGLLRPIYAGQGSH